VRRCGAGSSYTLNATAHRCTLERTPRLLDSLDIIKFLCKEFWTTIFKRKVDKLQTNHRVGTFLDSLVPFFYPICTQGVYVLQDYQFRWLSRFSSTDDEDAKREALKYLIFPCGLIRGALANLGVTAVVNADISTVPSCTYDDFVDKNCVMTLLYDAGIFNVKIKS
jgi:hypothetical protein